MAPRGRARRHRRSQHRHRRRGTRRASPANPIRCSPARQPSARSRRPCPDRDHRVHRRRATQPAAAHVQRLGLACSAPRGQARPDPARLRERGEEARGMKARGWVRALLATGLQEQDVAPGLLREACGQGRSRRASAHHDDVRRVGHRRMLTPDGRSVQQSHTTQPCRPSRAPRGRRPRAPALRCRG